MIALLEYIDLLLNVQKGQDMQACLTTIELESYTKNDLKNREV